MPNREHALEISLSKPKPLSEILAQVGIPLPEVALIAINGEMVVAEDIVITDEDEVRVFSAVNGG